MDDVFVFTFIVRPNGEADDYPTRVTWIEAANFSAAVAEMEDEDLTILHAFEGAQEDLIPNA